MRNLTKSFGTLTVVRGVDLDIEEGEFVVFVGPSGSGKSTLLRMIAGLEEISGGDLMIDDVHCNEVPPAKRGIAMVFQSYALYPHLNVERNLGFALETTGVSRAEIRERVKDTARMLQIDHLLGRKPSQLSGGQQQRVAIGRAVVRSQKLLLFDEPLSNLDTDLRMEMRVEIAKLHTRLGATTVYVTHDQMEAMTLADRIVVLRDGQVAQVGRPMDLYTYPADRFVAGFIGAPRMNFVGAELSAGSLRLAGEVVEFPVAATGAVTVGIRPEAIVFGAGDLALRAEVTVIEPLGGEALIHLVLQDGQPLVAKHAGIPDFGVGEAVAVGVGKGSCYLFDAEENRIWPNRPQPQ